MIEATGAMPNRRSAAAESIDESTVMNPIINIHFSFDTENIIRLKCVPAICDTVWRRLGIYPALREIVSRMDGVRIEVISN